MTITARSLTNLQVAIQAGRHEFISDEPPGIGDGAGPGPFDLLLGSLASCTIITLQMYAKRKQWPLEQVEASVDLASVETIRPDGTKGRSSQFLMNLTLHGPLTQEQFDRLEQIAERCPVHRTLSGQISITTTVGNKTAG